MTDYAPPFVYFGGKRAIADVVWERFGNVDSYIEPFAGSAAVLFARPDAHRWWQQTETINDADGMVCLAPETRILMADLSYRSIGSLVVGDSLVAFDEHNPGEAREGFRAPTQYRRWRIGVITHVTVMRRPSYRLTFSDGTSVVASEDHQWLGGSHRSGGRGWRWITTKNMVANRKNQCSWVLKVAPNIDREETWEAGWMGGFFEGEGHITGDTGWHLGVSQNEGQALTYAKQWFGKRGFSVSVSEQKKCRFLRVNGGLIESLRFLMLVRPDRLISKAVGKIASGMLSLYGRNHRAVALVRKEFLGEQDVIGITTDTKTFVAEGLASHNCNFWRALQADPKAVAHYADLPVNEADMNGKHAWLVGQRTGLTAKLEGDPEYYDVKIAGWWVWGLNCWIGSGWCSGQGPWHVEDGRLVKAGKPVADGVWHQRVHLGSDEQGVNRKRVHLGSDGQGVNRKLVHLGNGRGVNRKLVHLGDDGRGHCAAITDALEQYMMSLADRLRRVRVCSGDWSRICGPTPLRIDSGSVGVFLDPPYSETDGRDMGLYAVDDGTVAHDVREWAIEWGQRRNVRIALCGYEGTPMPEGWSVHEWKAQGGYAGQGQGESNGKANRRRERIWFNKTCLPITQGRLL